MELKFTIRRQGNGVGISPMTFCFIEGGFRCDEWMTLIVGVHYDDGISIRDLDFGI